MSIQDQLCIVQFPHSGKEHRVTSEESKAGMKAWNCGPHYRKFLKAEGCVVEANGSLRNDTLYFWGEWEPDSYIKELSDCDNNLPKYIHEPVLFVKKNSMHKSSGTNDCKTNDCQNTDPFVFDDYFIYSNCRQLRKKRGKKNEYSPTQLACLNEGSLIVFGSSLKDSNGNDIFVIDTVFVVKESRGYTGPTYKTDLHDFVPENFGYIMGCKSWSKEKHFMCYHGATPDNSLDGMYSFVPCRTDEEAKKGFERPTLNVDAFNEFVDGLFKKKLTRNFNITKNADAEIIKKVWDKLRSDIHTQGYEEGVKIKYQVKNGVSPAKIIPSKHKVKTTC